MRVLIVQKRFHPNSIGLVKALQAHGHEVHMIVHMKVSSTPSEDQTVLDTVHVPYYGFFYWLWSDSKKRHKLSVPKLGPILRELRNFHPDLVILKKSRLPNLIISFLARPLGSKPILLTDSPPSPNKKIKNRLLQAIGIKHWIFTATKDPEALDGDWFHGARLLPYPIEIPDASNERHQKNDGIRILCAGSLKNSRKRPWWVVEAVHRADLNQSVKLTFAGLGTPESEGARRISSLAETYGLQDRVRIIYNTPHAGMADLYARHDLLVHPARQEPFGAVVLEAMASGLPVLCSNEVGARSCFVPGESGMIFPAESMDAMASCLKQMCEDPANLFLMGKNARQRVKELYTGAAFVKHLESLIS